jgi:hypothetical protein
VVASLPSSVVAQMESRLQRVPVTTVVRRVAHRANTAAVPMVRARREDQTRKAVRASTRVGDAVLV